MNQGTPKPSIESLTALVLEMQALQIVSDCRFRALRHLLGELFQTLNIQIDGKNQPFDKVVSGLAQMELQAKLAVIADGDPAHASALTKYLIGAGHLKQTNDDSSATS